MVRLRWITVVVCVVKGVGIAEHHEIGVGSAHHWLMVIVGERIFAGEFGKIGRVALGYVIKAHCDVAFLSSGVGGGLPFEPAATVSSTHGKRSDRHSVGLCSVACFTLQSSCCHI